MSISPTLHSFLRLLPDPAAVPDADMVATLADEAPWFVLPASVRLRRCPDISPEEARQLSERIALNTPGIEAQATLIDHDSDLWAQFYPADDTPSRPDTTDAISTFLETYGHGDSPEDDALLERLIFNPQPDYASVLEEEYGSDPTGASPAGDDHTARIDAFLARPRTLSSDPEASAPEPAAPAAPAAAGISPTDSSLSESLAKIYIRQHRYDKAHEIISNLNLNFPEKSTYFADQLRFLQKLMINSRLAKTHSSD